MLCCMLVGTSVFQNCSIVCCIKDMGDFDKLKHLLKSKYNLEFIEDGRFSSVGYHVYNNNTDNRDIRLVVEQVDVL